MTVSGSLHVGLTLLGVYFLALAGIAIPGLMVFASEARSAGGGTGAMWVGTLGPWFF